MEETQASSSSTIASSSTTTTPAVVAQPNTATFNIDMMLDETNYDLWSSLFEMHVAGRRKTGYLRGTIPSPPTDDPMFDDWYSEDHRVKSWILSSMKPDLMRRYIRLSSSAEIWKALKTAFVDEKNEVWVYTLNQRASRIRQNGRPVTVYFGELIEVFQELDYYTSVAMVCPQDLKTYQTTVDRQRVYMFLGGLDDEFEQVRGEVLRKDPPLSLHEVYAVIRREAERRDAMKTTGSSEGDETAMAVYNRGGNNIRGAADNHSSGNSGGLRGTEFQKKTYGTHGGNTGGNKEGRVVNGKFQGKCSHCGMKGHSKERCFELIGYPSGWNKSVDPRKNKPRVSLAEETHDHELVIDQTTTNLAATTLHTKGNSSSLPSSVSNSTWIIDSGATSHMTFDSNIIKHLKPSASINVVTANGKTTPVLGEGCVSLTDTLNLDTVLVVPSLDYNLLSVTQLTSALNCLIVFWPQCCVFKDIQSRRTIGYGTKRGSLYYLDLSTSSHRKITASSYSWWSHWRCPF
ncbi:hypothetical protein Dimus_039807 [Dionaea muscipula]